MNHTLTYHPKSPGTNIGGYRYFFNGQEADNEMFGEAALHSFEYRMHDARLGRFWSVDPLAAKYPWNSTYAFAENSPIGYLEMEGLEKVQFGKHVVPFSKMNKDDVKLYLKKYKDYHHGNITVKEILQTDNDNEYWKVTDISDTYMRSIGTRMVKFNKDKTATLSDNVRMNPWQFITRYGDMEGHHDGSNSGRITREDVIVGLTIVSIMSGVGAMAETGFSVVETFGILNNFDDLIGFFANGKESLLQSITPNKRVINITKTLISGVNAGKDIKDVKRNIPEENYNSIMNTIMDLLGTGNNLENTISNEKKEEKK